MSNIKAISGSSRIINRPSGGGNKLQGIPSSSNINTTSHIAFNIRGTGSTYNRNLVFCMNQLSGVGKNKSQFNSSADGVNCNYCKNLYIQEYTNKYIYDINKYFKEQLCNLLNGKYNAYKKYNNIDNFTLCYVGDKETFINDITYNSKHTKNIINSTNFNLQNKIFSHLTNNTKTILINLFVNEYNTILINIPIPNYVYQKIIFINNNLRSEQPDLFEQNKINRYGIHTLGIIHNFQIKTINNSYVSVKSLLNKDNYGMRPLVNELSVYANINLDITILHVFNNNVDILNIDWNTYTTPSPTYQYLFTVFNDFVEGYNYNYYTAYNNFNPFTGPGKKLMENNLRWDGTIGQMELPDDTICFKNSQDNILQGNKAINMNMINGNETLSYNLVKDPSSNKYKLVDDGDPTWTYKTFDSTPVLVMFKLNNTQYYKDFNIDFVVTDIS